MPNLLDRVGYLVSESYDGDCDNMDFVFEKMDKKREVRMNQLKRLRRNELSQKLFGTSYAKADLGQKAKFISSYKWDVKKKRFIKAKSGRKVSDIKKDLIRKSKLMKKMGKRISRKAAIARKKSAKYRKPLPK